MRRSTSERGGRCAVRSAEEMMEVLEAFDLVVTDRGAAGLVGCDHKTVARLVELRARAGGGAPVAGPRARPTRARRTSGVHGRGSAASAPIGRSRTRTGMWARGI